MANWNALNPSGEEDFNAMRPREVKVAEPLSRDAVESAIHKILGGATCPETAPGNIGTQAYRPAAPSELSAYWFWEEYPHC